MNLILIAYMLFVLIVFAALMFLDVSKLRKKAQQSGSSKFESDPRTLVIIPCKGVDLNMVENLKSIANQAYHNFDIIAVVDDPQDLAVKEIRDADIQFISSSMPQSRASGKVKALLTALKKYPDYEVYVVADTDIIVDSNWLRSLISPLADGTVGISTMFPFFNSGGEPVTTLKMVWGFVGESLMDSEETRFGWGGSIAFRKDLIDEEFYKLAQESVYAVSDDVCLTMTARRKNLKIVYVKDSQPHINSKETFDSFMEWANRETALSIMGYKANFIMGIIYYGAEVVLLLSAIILSVLVTPLFLLLLIHYIRNVALSYTRAGGNANMFVPFVVLMLPFIYLSNLTTAKGMRQITWRGKTYPIV
jgi:cellulose synthase/poly-beta-1,6-N-acetylglucosamine synthase-like glycosyltransferase